MADNLKSRIKAWRDRSVKERILIVIATCGVISACIGRLLLPWTGARGDAIIVVAIVFGLVALSRLRN